MIPVSVRPLAPLLAGLQPQVLVDARMRKHAGPEIHRGLADFTIALGPSLVVGRHADVVIETSWEDLGRVITTGASLPLGGEPRAIDGHARDRYVYAPIDGVFRTRFRIGDAVRQGQEVAHIDSTALAAASRWRASWSDSRRRTRHRTDQGHRNRPSWTSPGGAGHRRTTTPDR